MMVSKIWRDLCKAPLDKIANLSFVETFDKLNDLIHK